MELREAITRLRLWCETKPLGRTEKEPVYSNPEEMKRDILLVLEEMEKTDTTLKNVIDAVLVALRREQ